MALVVSALRSVECCHLGLCGIILLGSIFLKFNFRIRNIYFCLKSYMVVDKSRVLTHSEINCMLCKSKRRQNNAQTGAKKIGRHTQLSQWLSDWPSLLRGKNWFFQIVQKIVKNRAACDGLAFHPDGVIIYMYLCACVLFFHATRIGTKSTVIWVT